VTRRAVASRLELLDECGVRVVRGLGHPAVVDHGLATLSRVTDHSDGWLVLGLGGAAVCPGSRQRWLAATGRIAIVELASRAIKRAVPRDRPRLKGMPPLAPTPSPRSFPSSHTAAAVAAVSAFDGLLPAWALRLLAATTAFSRLYLGVHYPSDVAAGAMLGRALGGRGRSRPPLVTGPLRTRRARGSGPRRRGRRSGP